MGGIFTLGTAGIRSPQVSVLWGWYHFDVFRFFRTRDARALRRKDALRGERPWPQQDDQSKRAGEKRKRKGNEAFRTKISTSRTKSSIFDKANDSFRQLRSGGRPEGRVWQHGREHNPGKQEVGRSGLAEPWGRRPVSSVQDLKSSASSRTADGWPFVDGLRAPSFVQPVTDENRLGPFIGAYDLAISGRILIVKCHISSM
nr:hypothetical protein Iba_chr11aCG13930 [Ipomoea batatas]